MRADLGHGAFDLFGFPGVAIGEVDRRFADALRALHDILEVDVEVGVLLCLGTDDLGHLLELGTPRRHVGQNAQLLNVRVVLGLDAGELGVESFVSRARQARVAHRNPNIRVAAVEVVEVLVAVGQPGRHLVGQLVGSQRLVVLDEPPEAFGITVEAFHVMRSHHGAHLQVVILTGEIGHGARPFQVHGLARLARRPQLGPGAARHEAGQSDHLAEGVRGIAHHLPQAKLLARPRRGQCFRTLGLELRGEEGVVLTAPLVRLQALGRLDHLADGGRQEAAYPGNVGEGRAGRRIRPVLRMRSLQVIGILKPGERTHQRVVRPLLFLAAVERNVLRMRLVQQVGVRPAHQDAVAAIGRRAEFPPAAAAHFDRRLAGVFPAHFLGGLAGAQHAGNQRKHGGGANQGARARRSQLLGAELQMGQVAEEVERLPGHGPAALGH